MDGKNKVMNKGIQMVNKQTDMGLIERNLGLENREALFLSNELRVRFGVNGCCLCGII